MTLMVEAEHKAKHFEGRSKELEEALEAEKLRAQGLEAELADLQAEVGAAAARPRMM
jgi:predicted  nucleic acid-binding Zn-ribbon protein